MLKNISLIASVISALTAVTTSVRALGKSRELIRDEIRRQFKTSCRMTDLGTDHRAGTQHSTALYLAVTVIWVILSVIFAIPSLIDKYSGEITLNFVLWTSPLLVLIILISLLWWIILH